MTRSGSTRSIAVLTAALCAGCAGSLNEEMTIGHSVELSTLTPDDRLPKPRANYEQTPPPSLIGISRDNWAPISFNVPVESVDHYATSSVQATFNDDNLRQSGAYPTEASVLEQTSGHGVAMQTLEGVASPFYSALDILMAFPRGIVEPPWAVQHSPRTGIQRTPRQFESGERAAPSPAPIQELPERPEIK